MLIFIDLHDEKPIFGGLTFATLSYVAISREKVFATMRNDVSWH